MNNGVKTDLQIKYSKFEVSNILVSDSVDILQAQFEAERTKKIESIEHAFFIVKSDGTIEEILDNGTFVPKEITMPTDGYLCC